MEETKTRLRLATEILDEPTLKFSSRMTSHRHVLAYDITGDCETRAIVHTLTIQYVRGFCPH